MSAIGLNVPADGRAAPEQITAFHATWVRVVAKSEYDLRDYFSTLQSRGVRVMLVLARESFDGFASWADGIAHYGRLYATNVATYQVGNESDLVSPSSWDMPVSELVALGKTARAALPGAHLVCAGMASGHPEYLDGADLSWCDSVACHPYLRDAPNPSDLEDLADMDILVREYQRFGKPVVVSEYGWGGDDETRAVAEVDDAIGWAANTSDCAVFFYFALLDDVPPFGLLRADGSEKPRAAAFKRRAAEAKDLGWPTMNPAPKPEPSKPDPWRRWAAEQIAAAAQVPVGAVRENWPRLIEQLGHAGIDSAMVELMLIGTIAKESASTFRPVREAYYLGEPEPAESYRKTLRYWPYYGRGFIQNTWRDSYAELGPKIARLWGADPSHPDFDFVGNPDKLLDPDFSAAAAVIFFRDKPGLLTAALAGNIAEVRRLVLGGQDADGEARMARVVRMLQSAPAPPVPADPRDELIAGYEIALRTLRDKTIPDLEAQVRELRRIVEQFIGKAA